MKKLDIDKNMARIQDKLTVRAGKRIVVLLATFLAIGGLSSIVQAATFVSFESESGTKSATVSTLTDAAASGGQYIQFNQASTPPPQPGNVQFQTDFATNSEFYNRFDYFVGNHCSPYSANTCRVEDHPSSHILSWNGDHNMACEAPTTSRTVNAANHNEYFWWCAPGNEPSKGHIMTAQNMTGYGIIAFTPKQDFNNVQKVCWDINSTDMGGGKWTNVLIIPVSEYVRHPNLNPKPNREGEGPYRLDYTTDGFNEDNAPGDFNIQDHDLLPGNYIWGVKNFRGVLNLFKNDELLMPPDFGNPVFTTDKAARFKHCFSNNSDNSVTITRVRPNGVNDSYKVSNTQIPQGQVKVIFQDDNYDPPKRDGYSENVLTWHWDNIIIE